MKKYSYNYDGSNYIRVTKKTAERLYNQSVIIKVIPCKLRPGAPWHIEMPIQYASGEFNAVCNKIIYHLCNNETGNYLSFYAPAWALSEVV